MLSAMNKRPSKLDNPDIQAVIRDRIARTGKETGCWQNVCGERQFYRWKRSNQKAFRLLKDSAIREFAARVKLSSPDLLAVCVEQAEAKLRAGECKLSEISGMIRLLLDARKELNAWTE